MDNITKPPITRLARKAGVKSMSDDCYTPIRELINDNLSEIIKASIVVNSGKKSKTLMVDDVYNALSLLNKNVTDSTELGTGTRVK